MNTMPILPKQIPRVCINMCNVANKADSDFNSEKESGVVMTSSGFPVGGDRIYYVGGVPGEETEGQRWRLSIGSGQKTMMRITGTVWGRMRHSQSCRAERGRRGRRMSRRCRLGVAEFGWCVAGEIHTEIQVRYRQCANDMDVFAPCSSRSKYCA